MATIVLESETFIITKVLKKTKAKFWKDLVVGDRIFFRNEIANVSGAAGSNGIYATYYNVFKINSEETVCNSQNDICRFTSLFELKQEF